MEAPAVAMQFGVFLYSCLNSPGNRMRSEAGQLNTFNRLMKYKPEKEEPTDTEKEGKENYKLTLGFVKSLTSKLSRTNIVISNDEEKETLKSQLALLSNAMNEFLDKYGLK